jgi:hypothetical protein
VELVQTSHNTVVARNDEIRPRHFDGPSQRIDETMRPIQESALGRPHHMDWMANGRERVDGESCVTKRDGEAGPIRPFESSRKQDPRGHNADTDGGRLAKGARLHFGLRAPATRRDAKPAP